MNNKVNITEDDKILKKFYSRYGGFWVYPDMLDYCYLVNPYFNRSKIIDEMQDNFRMLVSEYPAGMAVNSKLASDCWNVKEEYIIPGNGAAELIKALMENLEGKVGVVRPTFEEYPNRMPNERVVTFVPQNDSFRYDADDMIEFFGNNPVDTILLINPDNPSGNFIPMSGVHKLAQWCEDNKVRLILDESFVDFSVGFKDNTFINNDILEKYPHICVMKSISKSYGVPGLRLGILCSADTALIAKMKKQVSIWNINSFAEFYMQIFGKYESDYHRACESFKKERERFFKKLGEITFLRVIPSQANYFLCEVTDRFTSAELAEKLLEKDIIISNCGKKKNMQGRNLIRLAIRNSEDNDQLISELHNLE